MELIAKTCIILLLYRLWQLNAHAPPHLAWGTTTRATTSSSILINSTTMASSMPDYHRLAYIFSDSFVVERRFNGKGNRFVEPNLINTYPHMDENCSYVKIVNRGVSNATLDVDKWEGGIPIWANDLPDLTLISVGGCDIANTELKNEEMPGSAFVNKLIDFLNKFKEVGRLRAGYKDEFDAKMKTHIFLVLGIPVWGEDGLHCEKEDRKEEAAKIKRARRKANRALRDRVSGLWRNHRIVVFLPDMGPRITHSGIHYNWNSQQVLNDQICDVIVKLLCRHCSPHDDYIPAEHENKANNECNGAHPPH